MTADATRDAGRSAPSTRIPSGAKAVALRDATWHDIAELARLDAELFEHEAWSERTWWAEFAERPRRKYVVAAVDIGADGRGEDAPGATPFGDQDRDAGVTSVGAQGRIVGYAGLDVSGSTADVMTIAVAPEARGTGLGRRLLDHLVTAATRAGAEALLLEVRADNDPALHLYDKAGFERINVRRRYYQPGDVDAVIMRKLLEERR